MVAVACSDSTTTVKAFVAEPAFETDGFVAGSPLAGGTVRILDGDVVVVTVSLNEDGEAEVAIEPGVYTIQVELASGEYCLWGETVFEVELPTDDLEVAVSYICAGEGQ